MMTTNVPIGPVLLGYVERIENIREQKKALGEDEKVVFAELKAAGLSPQRVREVLKIRQARPHDLQEAQQELDIYLHALGMDAEAPLFRAVGLLNVDTAVREQVLEALKLLVPPEGHIVLKVGGTEVRLFRDEAGEPQVEDYETPKAAPAPPRGGKALDDAAPQRAEVPEVDAEGARELGRQAWRDNQPITSNPFPFGDKRRPAFDAGFREASRSDGMGPPEDGGEDEGGAS